jgi:hypothetical protein
MKTYVHKTGDSMKSWVVKIDQGSQTFTLGFTGNKKGALWYKKMLDKAFNNYEYEVLNKKKLSHKIIDKSYSVLVCDCNSTEHQILIYQEDDLPNGRKEVNLFFNLITYNNIFKRIIAAIKYIFGCKSKYGQWDCIIVSKDNYMPLKKLVEFIEN